jgi:dihydroorotase
MIDWKDKREFWIAGARIADPAAERMRVGSVLVQRGAIAEIVWQKSVDTDLPVLEADRFVLAPGFIDVHAHLREPGFEDKETIETGTAAAASGGYTAVLCMANTNPPIDDPSIVEYLGRRAALVGHCRLYIAGALTKGLQGEIINEYGLLKHAGVSALSDDGRWVTNSQVMRTALEYACQHGLPVIAHCEDSFLAQSSLMNEGYHSTRLGLRGNPAAAEEIAVSRDIMLAALTGAHLHVAHVSTAGAVDLIRRAKKRGVRVTAEAPPHHLTLDAWLLESYDTNLKVQPPLRGRKDIEALRAGLLDGTIDCVATDHAPHTEIDKDVEFDEAPPGMIGLETAFAHLHTALVKTGAVDLLDLVRFLTARPAEALELPGGCLKKDAPADLVLIDPEEEWTLDRALIRSRSRNTPLVGTAFPGRVQGIFLEGKWRSAIMA